MQDSVLLFAEPYDYLKLVAPDQTKSVSPPAKGNVGGPFNFPSLSPKGDLIAWGSIVSAAPDVKRFALGLYSVTQHTWQTYGAFDDIGTAAFSHDGSKIAFLAEEPKRNVAFMIFDVATHKMTSVPHPKGIQWRSTLGWSPDGKRLVVETLKSEKSSQIVVFDPRTGDAQAISEGSDPAWSPTGEWIAYYDLRGKKCMLVHPDGTGSKVAKHGGGSLFSPREFGWGLVWSPDGRRLLLNEMKGDLRQLNIDVLLVEIDTGRTTIKSRNGLPVFGWSRA
jgi:Tol biopolymer transport system component